MERSSVADGLIVLIQNFRAARRSTSHGQQSATYGHRRQGMHKDKKMGVFIRVASAVSFAGAGLIGAIPSALAGSGTTSGRDPTSQHENVRSESTARAVPAAGQGEVPREFWSWYNGWAIHSVWGAGAVGASFADASVACGTIRVRVRPVYDTHSSRGVPPAPGKAKSEVEKHNLALLKELSADGLDCSFDEISKPH